jgi:hypothetical protein
LATSLSAGGAGFCFDGRLCGRFVVFLIVAALGDSAGVGSGFVTAAGSAAAGSGLATGAGSVGLGSGLVGGGLVGGGLVGGGLVVAGVVSESGLVGDGSSVVCVFAR